MPKIAGTRRNSATAPAGKVPQAGRCLGGSGHGPGDFVLVLAHDLCLRHPFLFTCCTPSPSHTQPRQGDGCCPSPHRWHQAERHSRRLRNPRCEELWAARQGAPHLQQQRGGVGRRTRPCTSTGLSPTRRYAQSGASQSGAENWRGHYISWLFREGAPSAKRKHQGGVSSAANSLTHTQRGSSQPINSSTAVQGIAREAQTFPQSTTVLVKR